MEGIKNIYQVYSFVNQEGLVMTHLKELGWSGNYVLWNSTCLQLWISSSWRNFILSFFKQSNACLELRDGDQAELPSRRLEQYEQTLHVMYQCLIETCPGQEEIRHEVEQLMNALRQLLVRLESLYCHNNEESEYETNIPGSNNGFSLAEQKAK